MTASEYGDRFVAKMGAEAIKMLLEEIDIDALSAELHAQFATHQLDAGAREGDQAAEGRRSAAQVGQQPRVDGAGRDPGDSAGPAPAGAARRRPLRHVAT